MKIITTTLGYKTKVDDRDFAKCNQLRWHLSNNHSPYVIHKIKNKVIYLHRFIMGEPDGFIDRINGDTLDNRRSNLRVVTHQQNIFNSRSQINSSSKYRGVSRIKGRNRWRAQIGYNKKVIYLGYYFSEKEAAVAWNHKAKELFGEFARLNPV